MTSFEFVPPGYGSGTAPLVFATGLSASFRLLDADGIGPLQAEPLAGKGPGQVGVRALDVVIPARVVTLTFLLQASGLAAILALREDLAEAAGMEPVQSGEVLALGLLTYKRGGSFADLEIDAIARSVGLANHRGSVGVEPGDIEFLCPFPWWREVGGEDDVDLTIGSPLSAVTNAGDARAPILARIHGPLTNVTVTNSTTGRAFGVTGAIDTGDYVEVDTTPGAKRVELVSGGVPTNAMDRLNLAIADLWSLPAGASTVAFTADAGSGHVEIIWSKYLRGA